MVAVGPSVLMVLVFCGGLTLAPAMYQFFEEITSLASREAVTAGFG